MNIIFMGPPGAGKGTQSEFIVANYGLVHISTGDIFRDAIKNETNLGLEAKSYLDGGKLVPDSLTIDIVKERLAQSDVESGFLLDGFPRTIEQAKALDTMLVESNRKIDLALNLEADFDALIERLTARRICKDCKTSYHLEFNPPKVIDVCDKCGGELYQRSDDNEEKAIVRLNTYNEETKPLVEYYEKTGLLRNVDGLQSIDKVFEDIKAIIEEVK